ncbi:MAG: flagellar hook-basal body complex protein [Lachnospiraceae bacterium]|nr:flagellar hook-basal body complex protein [Lachnospiraceae bacterium]
MMRSLYSGVAGLKTHQTRMDVIGNNIANVNTTAYKSQSMTFSDLMYQTTQAASGANPTTGVGGVNARQIGLGSKTSAIKTAITGQGASQTTNDPFDIMITGSNFFVVNNGQENFFTRDGSFYVDGAGNLCMTSTGYNVMGWLADEDPNSQTYGTIKQDIVQRLQIMSPKYMTYPPEYTSKATLSGIVDSYDTNIANPNGKLVTLDFYDNLGFKYTAMFSFHDDTTDTLADGKFRLRLDKIKDPNGETLYGNANSSDDTLQFANNEVAFKFSTKDGTLEQVGDTAGNMVFALNLSTVAAAAQPPSTTTPPDTAGTDKTSSQGLPNFDGPIYIDCSTLTNLNNNGASTATCVRGDASNGAGAGRKLGEMSGVSIQKDGKIYATYDNGQSRLLGQIATASFANASGLEKAGDNLYSSTQNSGDFDGIGVDITAGGGYMNTGVLEMSNVDLSAEFTEMITTQRGFQANSRIITVSDTLLEELTNLKR